MKTYQVPIAFLLTVIIWTTTPLAIQWSSTSAPMTSLLLRMLVGILFCLALMGLLGMKLPTDEQARRLYVIGGLSMFGSMTMVYFTAQSIPSGWISVIFGLSPLVTGICASFVEPDSKLTGTRVFGILLGFVGLYLVFQAGLSFSADTLPSIAMLVVSVFIASISSVYIRKLSTNNRLLPMQITVGGLIVAIPFFALMVYLVEPPLSVALSKKEIASILYLGMIGTGVGFTIYYYLLKKLPASKVALITLITPVLSLLLGSMVNNEPILHEIWLGAACVFIGLLIYEFSPKARWPRHQL